MHDCNCKGTTKLQLLQRVFQRMLTKNMQFKDIEDSCQLEQAKKASCELLLTFNVSDYPSDADSGVTVLSPEEYLKSC